MNVLFYIPTTSKASERMYEVIEMVGLKAVIEIFTNIEDLSWRLRRPANNPSIATLLIRNREDLFELASIRELLSELPLIIILPDRKKANAAIGYSLTPRFLTYADSDFMEVGAVLEKILNNYKKNKVREE